MANPITDLYIKKEPKVPTIFAVLAVFLAVYVFSSFLSTNPSLTKADYNVIKNVQITNLSHNQVTMIWRTEKKEKGLIMFGKTKKTINKSVYDDRDLEKSPQPYYFHYVTIKNIQPNTKYYFYTFNGKKIGKTEKGDPFNFTTPYQLSLSKQSPAYGKAILANGNALANGLVIIFFDKGLPLSTITKESGEWLIPLNLIVDKKKKKQLFLTEKDNIKVEIASEKNKKTIINTDIKNISPLPQTTILGKNYNFSQNKSVLATTTKTTKDENNKKIRILFPKEKAIISETMPLIKGIALPKHKINIKLESSNLKINQYQVEREIMADEKGLWRLILRNDLSPGEYKLNLITKDELGNDINLNRIFSIARIGEKVLGEATGEAVPTDVLTPTIIPTEVLSSPTPTPTFYVSPTTTEPVSGGNLNPFVLTSASLIIVGFGLLLAF